LRLQRLRRRTRLHVWRQGDVSATCVGRALGLTAMAPTSAAGQRRATPAWSVTRRRLLSTMAPAASPHSGQGQPSTSRDRPYQLTVWPSGPT
jgi:hypothetical protein